MNENQTSVTETNEKLKEIFEKRNKLNKIGKAGLFGFIGACVLLVGSFLIDESFYITMIFPGFILAAAGIVTMIVAGSRSSRLSEYQSEVWRSYTPKVIEGMIDRLDKFAFYDHVDEKYLDEELGLPRNDRRNFKQYLKGVINGTPMEMSRFDLDVKKTEYDDDGDPYEVYEHVFGGIICVCRHTMEIKEDFTITQFDTYRDGIITESVEFNKKFGIHAENGLDVFRLLTPGYMETLLRHTAAKGKIFAVRFKHDGTLLIVLKDKSLYYEMNAGSIETITGEIEKNMRDIIDSIAGLELPLEKIS